MRYVLTASGLVVALMSLATGAENCVMTPTESSCSSYKYPYVEEDIAMLCMHMSSMTGCSVRKQCHSGGAKGSLCEPFSLLADLCRPSEGMQTMMGCHNYTKLCTSKSVVKECHTYEAFSSLPTTKQAKKLTVGACNEMAMMDGCTSCTNKTCNNPLMSYSDVCRSMPSMGECNLWGKFCKMADGDAEAFCPNPDGYCSGRGSVMWNGFGFYSGPMQPCIIFLFKGIIITEEWQYALSIFGILVSGILFQALTIGRRLFAQKCGKKLRIFAPVETVLFMLQQGWSYGLMFLAMTYRLDYFLSVIAGLGLGRLAVILQKGIMARRRRSESNEDMMAEESYTACCTNEPGTNKTIKKKKQRIQLASESYGVGTNIQCAEQPLLPSFEGDAHHGRVFGTQAKNTVTLRVTGMMCMKNCGTTVLKALQELDGVVTATMQFEQKLVVIHTSLPAEELIDAIEEVGFDAEEVKASSNV